MSKLAIKISANAKPETVYEKLLPYIDANQYTAVAVIFGVGISAQNKYDNAKLAIKESYGVVWFQNASVVAELSGEKAVNLQKVFTKQAAFQMFNVSKRKVIYTRNYSVGVGTIDGLFPKAGLA